VVLILLHSQLNKIKKHAKATYPEECCGILIGISGKKAIVKRVLPTKNIFKGDKKKGFEIDPLALAKADAEAEKKGWEIIGVYHSHPNCPGRPSKTDLKQAWPGISYFVISVINGNPGDYSSHRYNPEIKKFVEEPVIVLREEE